MPSCRACCRSQHFDGAAWIETTSIPMSLWTKALGRSTLTVLRGLKRNKYLQCHCALPGRSTLTVLRGLKLVSGAHDIDVIVKSQHFDGAAWIETVCLTSRRTSRTSRRSTLTLLRGLKHTVPAFNDHRASIVAAL